MRPEVPEDVADRVEDLVDEETRVAAGSLSFGEQLEILVEVAEERNTDRLSSGQPVQSDGRFG